MANLPPISVNLTATSTDALGNKIITFTPPWYQALLDVAEEASTSGGAAGGDLSGTYPNPTVAKIKGASLGTVTATNNYILTANGTTWNSVPMSGDATIAASGVITVGAGAITYSKIQNVTNARILGNNSGSAGAPQELSVTSPLSLSGSDLIITGAALTKTDDTNVTLTLGGSASSALVNATSLTLGWSGQLAVTRGGTGQSSYTDGQLLIGNSTGNTLTKATLTAGANITITNGSGSITIASTASGAAGWTRTFLTMGC